MENSAENVFDQDEEPTDRPECDIKFDPSDYLPRRTSRASAHSASEAIKKSMTAVKTEETKQEVVKETKDKQKSAGRTGKTKDKKFTKYSHSPYNCFVKLVRCEDDPILRIFMKQLKESQMRIQNSKYQVVYAPTCISEKKGLSQITANGVTVLQRKGTSSGPACSKKDSGTYQAMGATSSTAAGNSMGKTKTPPSLNVVVVHPKPGSKIINAGKSRESKSTLLHQMITDPETTISNKISRVMTTGGKEELHCNKCSKTFAMARDLVNHKRLAHKSSCFMCMTCATEFSSQDEVDSHECKAKFRCDICGVCCKRAGHLNTHKKMAHSKTLGEYMCYVCCFNASTQKELDDHRCGGKPKIVYSAQASSSVMVYPKFNPVPKPPGSTPQANIYVDITAPKQEHGTSSSIGSHSAGDQQYLCEVCLNLYPSSAALAAHKCTSGVPPGMDPRLVGRSGQRAGGSGMGFLPPMGVAPAPPMGMEVLPEVAELAKFYSSVVFGE